MQKRRFLHKHLKILPRTGEPSSAQKKNSAELGYCCRTCPPLALNFFWQIMKNYKKFCSVFGGNLNRAEFFICKQWVFWKVKCPQELGILFFETCNVMPLMLCLLGLCDLLLDLKNLKGDIWTIFSSGCCSIQGHVLSLEVFLQIARWTSIVN